MTKDEVLAEALECMEAAIKSGDWKVDGACDPTITIERMKHALSLETKRVPIDDEKIFFVYHNNLMHSLIPFTEYKNIIRQTERAHGIK